MKTLVLGLCGGGWCEWRCGGCAGKCGGCVEMCCEGQGCVE